MPDRSMLITGGAGFIGVNTAAWFLAQGWRVTVLDNLSRKGTDVNMAFLDHAFAKAYTFVRADIRTDDEVIRKQVEKQDVVIHLAAQVAVTSSVADPWEDFQCNALGTFKVLEAIRASKKRPALLYASTNKVYGGLEHLPTTEGKARYAFAGKQTGVDERCPLDFHSPYGCSKGAADQYVHDYARIYGLKTVVFRQSCIYGPHQLGVEDQGWVAWFLIAALLGRPVTIYGTGKQVRDLLYIDDLIRLYEQAIDDPDAVGQVFNVGGGPDNTLSLLEFLEIMKSDFDLTITAQFADWRPGDQPIFVSDNTKAKDLLGWEPRVGVRQGISQLHHWLKDNWGTLEKFYQQ